MHRLRHVRSQLPLRRHTLVEVPGKGWRAENISALCKGCGICAAGCPQRAIDMAHFRDKQILAISKYRPLKRCAQNNKGRR